jgi:SAM-dependent methyltransferase
MSDTRENNAAEWDKYWRGKNESTIVAPGPYDRIASFYRNRLIRPTLNYFIAKHFASGSRLVHAGCGSGEVDGDLVSSMKISAIDISPEALKCYRRNHPSVSDVKQCSIMDLSFATDSMDGIYNLGVMEHFSEPQIQDILTEFHRVLIPGGKIVLLWPPVFGLSVLGLHIIHFTMKWIFRNPTRLHPDEPSKIRSKKNAVLLLNAAGFQLIEFGFGSRDFFTYAVIVGQKTPA